MEITPVELTVEVCKILSCGIPAWLFLAWRFRRTGSLLPLEPRRPVPWAVSEVLIVLAIYILAAMCFTLVGLGLSGLKPSDMQHAGAREQLVNIAGDGVARIVTVFLAVVILQRRIGATAADLGFVRSKVAFDVICGTITFVALAPLVYAVQVVSEVLITEYSHPLITTVQQHRDPLTWITAALSAVVVAPVSEEFFFRGILQGWLEKMELAYCEKNDRLQAAPITGGVNTHVPIVNRGLLNLPLGTVPIVYSSALFALTHLGQGAADLPLFVLAIGLGFLYHRTHRLLPSITVHFLLNGLAIAKLFSTT
jgi:membrane protease YdiL (CAAX protease family)